MRLFSRNRKQPTLPDDIVGIMERFGHLELNPQAGGEDAGEIWQEWAGQVPSFANANPEGFLVALADTVVPIGGWAVYGASRTIWELFSSNEDFLQHPAYSAIMDAAIGFLRASGVPPMNVRGYEWNHWLDQGGTIDTWILRRPTPSPDEAPISALRPGETRRVTQLKAESDSNAILVRQNSDGRYCALIDAKRSDEDPHRVQNEWKFAASLYELYIQIGLAMQIPTYWYDHELEPYFPLPRPKI